jgi:PIN domain nuclease of toxin-antitoxin system
MIVRIHQIGIPIVSIFELADLATRGRVELGAPVRGWVDRALSREGVTTLPSTHEVALDAGQLRSLADPADRLIYATARAAGTQLVTRDERIRAFDPAIAVW